MKSIIFDMDGVIVDSEYDHAIANIAALKRFGVTASLEYVYRFVGTTISHMVKCMIEDNHLSVTPEELIDACNYEARKLVEKNGHRHIDGTVELIHTLKEKGYKLAIASSSTPVEIKSVTDYFQITDYFDTIVSGTYVKNPKPAPDIFQYAMELLHAKPADCFVIEDSTVGIQAAKSAGIETIGYRNPHSGNQDLSLADHMVYHMSDCAMIIS